MSVSTAFPKGLQELKAALETLNGGGLDYYTKAVDMLFDRFCPWKIGDRVVLVRAVNFENAPGWSHAQEWMQPGALGEVRERDTRNGLFTAAVRWDADPNYVYWYNEHFLRVVDEAVKP